MLASYTFVQQEDLPPQELFDPATKQPVTVAQPVPAEGASPQVTAVPVIAPAVATMPTNARFSWRDYLYWLPLMTLFPLALFLGQGERETVERQFERTLKNMPAEKAEKVRRQWQDHSVSLDDLFDNLPEQRLVGAHLPRGSQRHLVYALAAAVGFGLLLMGMFRAGSANPLLLVGIALLSGTVGIGMLLLAYEFIFVGDIMARAADDPESSFTFSLIGFTLGVGLFEETAKAIPVIYYLYSGGKLSWRAGFLWGFASGLGFGISEGITYAAEFYNGITSWDIYLVRFASCVALHAMWSASVGLLLARWGDQFEKVEKEWYDLIGLILMAIAIPALLHGAYDALLSRHLYLTALFIGLVSFGYLAWLVEERHRHERETEPQPVGVAR